MSSIESLRYIDLVLVIDSTGSMDPYLDEVKRKVIRMLEGIERLGIGPKVFLGLVVYGDHPPQDTILTQSFQLTGDRKQILDDVRSLPRTGGGDYPEAVVDGLHVGISMPWRTGSARVLILIGDAPPHGYAQSGDAFPKGCPCGLSPVSEARRAKELGITIHAVGVNAGSDVTAAFSSIASAAGGTYLALDRAETLLPIIQKIMRVEEDKMVTDVSVYEAAATAKTGDLGTIAARTGIAKGKVDESLLRLEKRGLLTSSKVPIVPTAPVSTPAPMRVIDPNKCPRCGSKVSGSDAICWSCGKPLR